MTNHRPSVLMMLPACCLAMSLGGLLPVSANQAAAAETDQRVRVSSAADMPALTFKLSQKPSRLVSEAAALRSLAEAVYNDAGRVLETHDFADQVGRSSFREAKANAALILGRAEEALQLQIAIGTESPKEDERLTAGITTRAIIAAQTAGPTLEARKAAFRTVLDQQLAALPYAVVETRLRAVKARFETLRQDTIIAAIAEQMDPIHARSGSANLEMADALLSTGFALSLLADYRADMLAALNVHLGSPAARDGKDIWAGRIASVPKDGLTPVRVAIWDTGFDPSLFAGQLYENVAEAANGRDDDGNGHVDDRHGIAFDRQMRRSSGALMPLPTPLAARRNEIVQLFQGMADLGQGISSREADGYRNALASMPAAKASEFVETMERYANHMHGTHVAGIAAAGNPGIRLLHVRMEPHVGLRPEVPDEARMAAFARAFGDGVAYLRASGVRVANLSWGLSRASIEQGFEANGLEPDPAARRRRVDGLFAMAENAMRAAIAGAPDILFVVAAGNKDTNLNFAAVVPAGIELPNVITVGAVDAAGRLTGFTSTGAGIDLHANGQQIESVVPGGAKVRFNGTSMAAPQVTNLAAKLLAVRPTLTTSELATLIRKGADAPRPDGVIALNPRRSMEIQRGMN